MQPGLAHSDNIKMAIDEIFNQVKLGNEKSDINMSDMERIREGGALKDRG